METPHISSTSYAASVPAAYHVGSEGGLVSTITSNANSWNDEVVRGIIDPDWRRVGLPHNIVRPQQQHDPLQQEKQPVAQATPKLRIVRVFIADTNENLPVDKRLIYAGKEQTTDLTDQELFFEVPIQELLKTHNALRAQTKDKTLSTKDNVTMLEPVRIRDLQMVVLGIAQF